MNRTTYIVITMSVLLSFFLMMGCDKEKIVESTEYIETVQYIEQPGDTVYQVDTIYSEEPGTDTVWISGTDTLWITDTLTQTVYEYDTVFVNVNHYDTIYVTDTVTQASCEPNPLLAISAMHFYGDLIVIDFINQEFGYDDGWVFYLSTYQIGVEQQSSSVYDFYGYIDYWTPDWSGYYPLEFYWRLTYTGGDPADPDNWQLSDPPTSAPGMQPGLKLTAKDARDIQPAFRPMSR